MSMIQLGLYIVEPPGRSVVESKKVAQSSSLAGEKSLVPRGQLFLSSFGAGGSNGKAMGKETGREIDGKPRALTWPCPAPWPGPCPGSRLGPKIK